MRTDPYILEEREAIRLCQGSQAIKGEWTADMRTQVVVSADGTHVHERLEEAEPFNLWEAVRA